MNKKAILVVSFGTSYEEALKNSIEATENAIKETFIEFEVRRAFTSNMIIKKLKNRDNYHVDNVTEALEKLRKDGYEEVYVQPLHIIFGEEYDKIQHAVNAMKELNYFKVLELSTPLLYKNEDYINAFEALRKEIAHYSQGEGVILMAHGTAHQANACYFQLQTVAQNMGATNVHIATVEGYPTIEEIIPLLKRNNYTILNLIPFMLVCGDHARNDMASDEEDSWKSILEGEGFKVNCILKGLGEIKGFQQLYVKLLEKIISN
ncbi:sirohydrochlorin cobaltochelatase [Clostridium sp. UBA4548]|uniref:sirohydrochlorin cobaltochelatase n=1 Tax=Clostridium sp. UBA4548 TaxID=1946361 RepID=UPI0025BCEA69|nr:sirohydrochlorin cobaltochelatase [Clostridium sp. UBA4548]